MARHWGFSQKTAGKQAGKRDFWVASVPDRLVSPFGATRAPMNGDSSTTEESNKPGE